MSHPSTSFSTPIAPSSTLKNMLLALGMVLFLALSFKLTNDLTGDTSNVSQTDSVLSSLNTPAPTASLANE